MIKTDELMIGNYIQDMEGNIYKIFSFSYTLIQCDKIEGGSHIFEDEEVKPIPLTKEWLKKLGFYVENSKDRLSIEAWGPGHPSQRFNIDFKDDKILLISRYQESHDFLKMRHIVYIHQLQNLYFSLTGEKLTLKK